MHNLLQLLWLTWLRHSINDWINWYAVREIADASIVVKLWKIKKRNTTDPRTLRWERQMVQKTWWTVIKKQLKGMLISLSLFFISTEHGKESVNRNSNRKQTRRANPHIQTHAVYHYLSYLLQKKGCCNSATSLQCLKQSCCPLRTGTV